MTAVDNIKYWCAHSGMTDQVGGFQNPGVCLQAFSFLSSPPPPSSFSCAIFCVVFDSRSSFFAPKPHGNACYAGYDHSYPRPTVCVTYGFHNMSKYRGHMGRSLYVRPICSPYFLMLWNPYAKQTMSLGYLWSDILNLHFIGQNQGPVVRRPIST